MAPLAARGSSIKPLNELTATEIIAAIGQGQATCEAVVHACLERIAAREPEVHAWTHLDPEAALAAARAFDKNGKHGPLAGVPFGVKDIIDTVDLPTEWGTPIHKGRRPGRDAACVALSRKAGGVLLSVHCSTPGQITRAKELLKETGAEDMSTTGEAAAEKATGTAPRT